MDASHDLRVVVFESANPDFFLAHFDLTGKTGNITTAVGPSGLPILADTFVRISKIRGGKYCEDPGLRPPGWQRIPTRL